MKKKLSFLLLVSVISTCALLFSTVANSSDNLFFARGDNVLYGINCNSSKNKFFNGTGTTSYSGEGAIKTDLGNDIDFTYSNLAGGSSSVWHLIKADGYFYNTTPIHGISNLSLQFTAADKMFKIYWSGDLNFVEERSAELSSDTSRMDFGFNDYFPTYFKFVNISGSNLSITNLAVLLTCENNRPVVTVFSENQNMGFASGGGAKTPGEQVTITATPNQGYRFIGWYDGESLISTNPSYQFTIGNEDLTYAARFTYETYNFVVESESLTKGSVSNSSGQYDYLSNVTIEATANTGYSFTGWYEGNNLVSTNNPYTFPMPYANKTYTAKFTANPYDLTLVNANEELGSITGEGTYLYGSSVTIVATPNTGVSFLGWYNSEDQEVCSTESYTFDMPHEDIEYIAKFAWTPYSVTVNVNDDEMGSVSGAGSYTYGQQVNLVATPEEHHSFFGWYINDEFYSRETWLTFDMPADNLTYEARFVKNYNLYVSSDNEDMGTVDAPSEWGAGLEVTVTANAKDGYAIDYWADTNYDEIDYNPLYTFVMPAHDIELIAVFNTGYILTVTSSDETKGTVVGANHYMAGRNVTVSMNYISGTFKGWFDNKNNLVSTDNPYSFIMPSNSYSLEARFMTNEEEEEKWNKAHGLIPVISQDGKTVTYGLYPQTNINDSSLISALNSLTTPESNGWYLYNNDYYAKLTATPYNSGYIFDNGTTCVSGTTYWFKCEPITWKILSTNNGEHFILSSMLLDAHRYNEIYDGTKDGHYANNYKHSEIRKWLNDDFYNSAFALNDSYIKTTTVDNSVSTTNSYSNPYVCESTQDKVFLPSYGNYLNSSYGFSTSTSNSNTRNCRTTDWAIARGSWFFYGFGNYGTRSPYSDSSFTVWFVNSYGELTRYSVNATDSVRPAINLSAL